MWVEPVDLDYPDEDNENPSARLNGALRCAAFGWPVVPSFLKKWPGMTTVEADRIKAWAIAWPNRNFWIATGYRPGSRGSVCAVELWGQEGDAFFASLVDQHGPAPATVTASGGHGTTLFFRAPKNCPKSNRNLEAGFCFEGQFGTTHAPGSSVRGSLLLLDDETVDHPLAELPHWLLWATLLRSRSAT